MTTATPFQQMRLDTTLSLAVIATGLMVSWAGTAVESPGAQAARIAVEDRVTVSQQDGRFHMTVTAQRPSDFVRASAPAQVTSATQPTRT